jgi:glycosyltransferase involved in cell wall biosynthesis
MAVWPRISIVTPSFNQGHYIAETIDSVFSQDYPNLEHIVIDGGSTDTTLNVLRRYPHLRVVSEPDRGQADAINKGFRLATGAIWGFLNSDDTLLPHTLHRVAQEIDTSRGRHIVMGRCRFVDVQGQFIGVEHPSYFHSHLQVLAVWKGHTIPQPAVFWTPEVWHTCGGMDETLQSAWIDYDLFCRFSRAYHFHFVDQLFATYRLHETSKTEQKTNADRLEECIEISRRHWGSPLTPRHWQSRLSLAWYRFNRIGRAQSWLRKARDNWERHQKVRAMPYALAGSLLAPEVTFYSGLYPLVRAHTRGTLHYLVERLAVMRDTHPQTRAHLSHTRLWPDDWAGPHVILSCNAIGGEQELIIQGSTRLQFLSKPLILTVSVDGKQLSPLQAAQNDVFAWRVTLPNPLVPGAHTVEIHTNAWFVPHRFTRNGDYRPLAWRMGSAQFAHPS